MPIDAAKLTPLTPPNLFIDLALSFRKQVEGLLEENPKFRAVDKAIGKEGFKIILLLRLSPIFPFALSNYLYGVTSVDFFEFMGSTLLGFFPGTLAYVYGGMVSVAYCPPLGIYREHVGFCASIAVDACSG